MSGLEGMRSATIGMVVLAIFSAIGSLACVAPVSRPVSLRLIGGTVFLTCLGYLTKMLIGGPVLGKSRADESLVNSIFAFTVFGLPAGYVAIKGRYPGWGRHAKALGANEPRPLSDTPRDNPLIQS
jgi:hypothetical protein